MHPQEMLFTIARCMFITPSEPPDGGTKGNNAGYDWRVKQKQWESLTDNEKQFWLDKAKIWLNLFEEKKLNAYEFYIFNWMADLKNSSHLFTD